MLFLAFTPGFESTSFRVAHVPVGAEGRLRTGHATARCLLQRKIVHFCAILHKEKYIIFSVETAIRPSA